MTTRSGGTKVDRLAERLAGSIEQGVLQPGTRMRSVRDAAARDRLARNTVIEAYSRLVARGFIESRPRSGFYVRRPGQQHAGQPAPHVAEAVDVMSLLREQLEQHYDVRVGDGRPPPSWMESSELGRILRRTRALRLADMDHGYGTPWGYFPLRETIARLLADRAIPASPRQLLLTQGANHALDLIVRHLLEPGDTVLVDSPGYYPLFGKLKLARVVMHGVPRMADGPDIRLLQALLREHRPKAFFTQSLAHNPTGGSISIAKARRLLQLSAEHDCTIVEDDPFADLQPDNAARLAALDRLEHVIYVSSFSKTLSAGLRVGYIAGSVQRINALCDLKMVTMVSTSDFVERMVHQLMASGQYRRHLRRLMARLDDARPRATEALARTGVHVHPADPGGYYLWVELPATVSERALTREASRQGIFLAPGSVFFPDRQAPYPALRVNVAHALDPRFLSFLHRATGKPSEVRVDS